MKNLKRGQSPIPSIGSSVAEGEARKRALTPFLLSLLLATCCWLTAHAAPASYDVILRGGTIYDGSGEKPYTGDVAIRGDRIAAMGDIGESSAPLEINVAGLAVAPGFVNMMSWANESLIEDGKSQSDIRQGVTLEIMGEGDSMGPLNDRMKQDMIDAQTDIRYEIEWTTLAEYLAYLERRGISPNVASFIGAATPRNYVIGQEDRAPTYKVVEDPNATDAQRGLRDKWLAPSTGRSTP